MEDDPDLVALVLGHALLAPTDAPALVVALAVLLLATYAVGGLLTEVAAPLFVTERGILRLQR